MKIIYVDIDETICYYKKERQYEDALPIKKNIEKINRLYDEGNKIVYWTARGYTTGINHYQLTLDQLEKWGAKHHQLKTGKPNYDLFICDKSINSAVFFKNEEERGIND